jgi:hypothetical protein
VSAVGVNGGNAGPPAAAADRSVAAWSFTVRHTGGGTAAAPGTAIVIRSARGSSQPTSSRSDAISGVVV